MDIKDFIYERPKVCFRQAIYIILHLCFLPCICGGVVCWFEGLGLFCSQFCNPGARCSEYGGCTPTPPPPNFPFFVLRLWVSDSLALSIFPVFICQSSFECAAFANSFTFELSQKHVCFSILLLFCESSLIWILWGKLQFLLILKNTYLIANLKVD